MLSAAGLVCRLSPAVAEESAASPTADERKRMAALASDFMDANKLPGLSIAIAIKGKLAMSRPSALPIANQEKC